MFADYEKSVISFYKDRKTNKTLSPLLSDLTPGNLKRECHIRVSEERYHKTDDWTLRAFFEQGGDKETFLQAIKRCDIDKFRPLINFLSGRSGSTAETNIELLAWLIDFKPRPYDENYDYMGPEAPDTGQEVPEDRDGRVVRDEDGGNKYESALAPSKITRTSFIFNLWKGVAMIALFVCIIFGINYYNGKTKYVPTGPQACMFWDGDHYQQVSCNQKIDGALVIALDSEKVIHFRKITRPDTITERAIGRVWYVRYEKQYEFYTSGGFHPIDPRLRLLPITSFIIRRHIPPNQ